jgi:hypothetical protein
VILSEGKINKKYKISSVEFCEPCLIQQPNCPIVGLMEKGLLPKTEIKIKNKLGGLIHIWVEGSGEYIVREEDTKNIFINE